MTTERTAGLSLIFRLELTNTSITFGKVAHIIGEEYGDIIGVDVVHVDKDIAIATSTSTCLTADTATKSASTWKRKRASMSSTCPTAPN